MSKKIIILLGVTIFLFGCKVSDPNIKYLNCEQAIDVFSIVGDGTSERFNGKSVSETQSAAIVYCESNKIEEVSQCENLKDTKNCYFTLGIQANKMRVCEDNNACKLAYATSHIANCGVFRSYEAGGYNLENICLIAKAFIKNEEEICNQIEIESLESCEDQPDEVSCYFNQSECLWGMSDRKNSLDICEDIPGYKEKRLCYMSYALKNNDIKACGKINKVRIEQLCADMVEDSNEIPEEGILGTYNIL